MGGVVIIVAILKKYSYYNETVSKRCWHFGWKLLLFVTRFLSPDAVVRVLVTVSITHEPLPV